MSISAAITLRGFELTKTYRETQKLSTTWAHFRVVLDSFQPQTMSDYPQCAQRLIEKFPHLRMHACDNETHSSFTRELATTEIPHALEHVMVELLAQESSLSRFDIKGQTGWDFKRDGYGVYRLRIKGFESEDQARRISQQACVIFQDLSR